jgi:uncharacterized membrane protein
MFLKGISFAELIKVSILFILIDLPYLTLIKNIIIPMTEKIQGGRPVIFRMIGAIPVYIAMSALLLSFVSSVEDAFLLGACTYIIYDFTSFALLKDYRLDVAIIDSIWGGILFSSVYWIYNKL